MDKLDHLGWVVSSSFAIGEIRFAIRSTSRAFGRWVSDVMGAYEVDDVEDFLYSVVVPDPPAGGKAKEFCILYKGASAVVRTLDPVTLGRGLFAELEGLGLQGRDDAVYVVASLVDMFGGPTLAPSSIGPTIAKLGKRATKLGMKAPGQLTVAIDLDTASVVPIPPTLEVPGDALERLAAACPWEGPDELYFPGARQTASAFLVPARERDAPLREARRGYALANLAGWTVNLERTGGRGLEALGRFVERTPCFESAWTDGAEVMTVLADRSRARS